MKTMRAVGSYRGLPIEDDQSLVDLELPMPQPRAHDLLVAVDAVSVNPVDVTTRAALSPSDDPTVLGFDAVGTVTAIGDAVRRFAVGDRVYYSGDNTRQGSNAEFQAVDERIVGHAPVSLSAGDTAAMPLTTIVAWEALFERLRLSVDDTGTLLVVGASGGVGSIAIQLAKQRTGLKVIGTASSPESQEWARHMGADVTVDHSGDLVAAVTDAAPDGVDAVLSTHSHGMVDAFSRMIRPFGQIVAIDALGDDSIDPLKPKSIAWHWELMFTRPSTGFDLLYQGRLLDEAATMFDAGTLTTTATTTIQGFTAANLRHAHALVEHGGRQGKVVVVR